MENTNKIVDLRNQNINQEKENQENNNLEKKLEDKRKEQTKEILSWNALDFENDENKARWLKFAALGSLFVFIGALWTKNFIAAITFFLLAFVTFLSSFSSSKGKVYGICGGFFALSYAIHVLVGISDRALDFYFLSFFKYYGSPGVILTSGSIDIRNTAVFLTAGTIFLLLGLMIAEGRDLL